MLSKSKKDIVKTETINGYKVYYLSSEMSEKYYYNYYGYQDIINIEIDDPRKQIYLDLINLTISEFDKSLIVLRNVYGYTGPTGEQVINS